MRPRSAADGARPHSAGGMGLPSVESEDLGLRDAGAVGSSGAPARRIVRHPGGDLSNRPKQAARSHGRGVSAGITSRGGRPCGSCCGPASARCTRC